MKRYYIRKFHDGEVLLYVEESKYASRYLCCLDPLIFKLSQLKLDERVYIKELPLKEKSCLIRPVYSYCIVTINNDASIHCPTLFEKYTHKRFHMSVGRKSKPISTIKLKLT